MKSVKGMTWGTPEFVAIAKQGEDEGDISYKEIEKLESVNFDKMYQIELLPYQKEALRETRAMIDDVLGEYGCYGECEGLR